MLAFRDSSEPALVWLVVGVIYYQNVLVPFPVSYEHILSYTVLTVLGGRGAAHKKQSSGIICLEVHVSKVHTSKISCF
jgi:hypothetical protein